MKIGIYDIDKTRFPNYALMKISQYYKQKSNSVEWYNPLWHDIFDKIYCSSIFTFSDKSYVTNDMICGGSGFDVDSVLPEKIEKCGPDYSIYPDCDYSIIWFDRGCFRQCPFCIVKEHRVVNYLTLNPKGKHIKVMDDNFFYGNWKRKIKWLLKQDQPVDMQNVDARLLTKEMADSLNSLTHYKQIKMSWDNPKENLDIKFMEIAEWINPSKIMVYVLIGYWGTEEEDLWRVERLRKLKYDPFVMPYNKHNEYRKNFARWVNHKAIFKSIPWKLYYRNRYTKATIEA